MSWPSGLVLWTLLFVCFFCFFLVGGVCRYCFVVVIVALTLYVLIFVYFFIVSFMFPNLYFVILSI